MVGYDFLYDVVLDKDPVKYLQVDYLNTQITSVISMCPFAVFQQRLMTVLSHRGHRPAVL